MTIPRNISLTILPTLLIIAFNSCAVEERIRSNPHDPLTVLEPNEWAPSNLTILRKSNNDIILNWEYERADISGFKVDRKINDGEWQSEYGVIDIVFREWKDDSAIASDATTYHYKLYAYATNNSSSDLEIQLTDAAPQFVDIISITYDLDQMAVSWNQYSDPDFFNYAVLYSDTETGTKTTIETITDANSNTYTLSEFNPTVENWFWVQVTDTMGLSSIGNGMSNSIDAEPNQVDVTSVTYDLETMTIVWVEYSPDIGRVLTMNQSLGTSVTNDFVSYELLYSSTEDGEYTSVVVINEIGTTSHSLSEFDPTQENWFKIKITDFWNLTSSGDGMTNEIDSPPTSSEMYPVVYQGSNIIVSWSQNNDNDFLSYHLFESESADMSNQTEIFTSEDNTETSYNLTGLSETEYRYLHVVVQDVWGLESTSNIGMGSFYYRFVNTFGGSSDEIGESVQQTTDGGYIITGSTESFGNGGKDVWLIKIDNQGNLEWNKIFGGENDDIGYSVTQTNFGGYIITGSTESFGNGGKDVWLIKTDSQGNEDWNQTFGDSLNDVGEFVQQTADGGFIVAGWTNSFSNGDSDSWLIKTNSNGGEEWNQNFGGSNADVGLSVAQLTDGGYIVTGYTESLGSAAKDAWLYKTDMQGNALVIELFGGSGDDIGESVLQTNDGGYIVTGYTESFGNGSNDIWLIKTDSDCNQEWSRTFGGSNNDFGKSVRQTNDGGYIVTGWTNSSGSGGYDSWLIKTNSNGNEEWSQTFGGTDIDVGESVLQTNDGGYIVTGWTSSSGSGGYDFWLIKTDPDGNAGSSVQY
jgi:predicted secreted protein